jgi:hypothetical protein
MAYHRIYSDKRGRLFVGEPVFAGATQQEHGATEQDMSENFGLNLVDEDLDLGADYYDFGEDDDDVGMDYASLGAMDYADLGAGKARRAGKGKRGSPKNRARKQVVQKTLLTGQTALNPGAGIQTVTIRPQYDFVAEDMSFAGSVGDWLVMAMDFGDRRIFNNAVGIPIALFANTSFIRGLCKGAAIAAGLDIIVQANLAASTTTSRLMVQLIGLKRGTTGCGPGAV